MDKMRTSIADIKTQKLSVSKNDFGVNSELAKQYKIQLTGAESILKQRLKDLDVLNKTQDVVGQYGDDFKNKIDELAKLSGEETEVQLFLKNYEALKAQLANPALDKATAMLVTLKQNTVTMVNDINTFLEKVGFDEKYKIKI